MQAVKIVTLKVECAGPVLSRVQGAVKVLDCLGNEAAHFDFCALPPKGKVELETTTETADWPANPRQAYHFESMEHQVRHIRQRVRYTIASYARTGPHQRVPGTRHYQDPENSAREIVEVLDAVPEAVAMAAHAVRLHIKRHQENRSAGKG